MTSARNPLLDRLEEARNLKGLSERAWSLQAGLADSYVKTQRNRATDAPDFVLPEKEAPKLAEVVGVTVEWLRFGRGPRDAKPSDAPPEKALVRTREPKPTEVALAEAYARGATRYTARDFLAALELVRGGEQHWGDTEEAQVLAADGMLSAVARVRRSGAAVTWEAIAGASFVRSSDDDEGARELARLGGAPPAVPIRTPPRGTPPAVPKPVKRP